MLGSGRREDREWGTTGNHILVSQGSPSISQVLPPTSRQLSESFVAVFGQNKEQLSKCHVLSVNRDAYKTLAEERVRVNSAFVRTTIDQQAVSNLPVNGVPQQLMECGVHMPEAEKYAPTRCGPGTLRDPLDAKREGDDAEDEISDVSSGEGDTEDATTKCGRCDVTQQSDTEDARKKCGCCAKTQKEEAAQLNHFETPLGLDPTAVPDFVQHVAAFKAQVNLVHDAVKEMRSAQERQSAAVDSAESADANCARVAVEEDCKIAVVDLRAAAQKLEKHKFEEKIQLLEDVDNKAMFVPGYNSE